MLGLLKAGEGGAYNYISEYGLPFLCDNWIYSEVGLIQPTSTASHLGEI